MRYSLSKIDTANRMEIIEYVRGALMERGLHDAADRYTDHALAVSNLNELIKYSLVYLDLANAREDELATPPDEKS